VKTYSVRYKTGRKLGRVIVSAENEEQAIQMVTAWVWQTEKKTVHEIYVRFKGQSLPTWCKRP
jgi:hypothetical protein